MAGVVGAGVEDAQVPGDAVVEQLEGTRHAAAGWIQALGHVEINRDVRLDDLRLEGDAALAQVGLDDQRRREGGRTREGDGGAGQVFQLFIRAVLAHHDDAAQPFALGPRQRMVARHGVEDGEVIGVHVDEIVFAGGHALFERRNVRRGAEGERQARSLRQRVQHRGPALGHQRGRFLRDDAEAVGFPGPYEGRRRRWIQLGLAALCAPAGLVRAGKTYSFGSVPQESASRMAESWTPVLNALAQRSGLALTFSTAPDIPTFEKRVAAGEYDFVYMNPYHFTVFNAMPGYHALARAKSERLRGIVVVRKDSPYKELKDLTGAAIAFPSSASFAATLVIQADLRKHGIAFEPKIVKSHISVYLDVAKGLYPAGGGVPRTFKLLDDSVARELRILYTSADYTSHAIASRPGMDAATRDKLLKAMLAMSQDAASLEMLQGIGFKVYESAADRDWDDVRALGIRPADSQIQK